VNPVWPVALLLLALALLGALLWRQRRQTDALRRQLDAAAQELQQLQHACARLAPAGVVHRLVADGATGLDDLPPQRRVATALFADLVDSTAMGERLDPAVLARVLNGYFQRMSDAIHAQRGHVSTYLGDGLLAYFGALQPNPWQCADAVRAALAMRAALASYNTELAREDLPPLALGIGIHRGSGLAGMIGSSQRMEYGFVGRTVNVAARAQALTRLHGADILVTDAVCSELGDAFVLDAMPPEMVKGIAEPLATFAVRGVAERSVPHVA
jgi:class 3 adenylate cyclase